MSFAPRFRSVSVVDQEIGVAVAAGARQIERRAGIDLDGAAWPANRAAHDERAAGGAHDAGIHDGVGNRAEAEELAGRFVGDRSGIERAAADLHIAAVGEGGRGREVAIIRDAEECAGIVQREVGQRVGAPVWSVICDAGPFERDAGPVGVDVGVE